MSNNDLAEISGGAKDLLLADLKYLNDSFWKNEEIGEKRVTFFIILVAAVLAFLGAMAKAYSQPSLKINIFALVVLLAIGVVVLFRLIKRNKVSEEYKEGMDYIRDIFKQHFDQEKYLVGYHIRKEKRSAASKAHNKMKLRQFGGLTYIVATLNSLIAAALTGVILSAVSTPQCSLAVFEGGFIIFLLAFVSQYWLIQRQERLAKQEIWGLPSQSSQKTC
jgi:uncharacterized membrane protein YfcA